MRQFNANLFLCLVVAAAGVALVAGIKAAENATVFHRKLTAHPTRRTVRVGTRADQDPL